MMRTNPTYLAQFGGGFEPPTQTAYTPGNPNEDNILLATVTAISNALGILTVLAGLFFIFYFLIGAIMWLTSGGDSGKLTKARDQMLHGVIGLVIVVVSYSVIGFIGTLLGLDLLDIDTQIRALIPR